MVATVVMIVIVVMIVMVAATALTIAMATLVTVAIAIITTMTMPAATVTVATSLAIIVIVILEREPNSFRGFGWFDVERIHIDVVQRRAGVRRRALHIEVAAEVVAERTVRAVRGLLIGA